MGCEEASFNIFNTRWEFFSEENATKIGRKYKRTVKISSSKAECEERVKKKIIESASGEERKRLGRAEQQKKSVWRRKKKK